MKILWLTWKDRHHPAAGGAETVSGEIMDRLVRDGHELKIITATYKNAPTHETHPGLEVFRVGNRYSVYSHARKLYKKQLENWPDIVIDEMNTIPFGSAFYNKTKNVLLCYQLARQVWFYQMPFPLSLLGFSSEPFMLRSLAKKYTVTATESNSTKSDLEKYGFTNVRVFRIGMALPPITSLTKKHTQYSILSLGAIRPMKRTLDAVKAFEAARDQNNALHMIIAGDATSNYAKKVLTYIKQSRHASAIDVKGRVSAPERLELMRQANLIVVTSVKEGWGLIVTEANSQGTPAVVYDTDGLRDSVQDGNTGILSPNSNPEIMGEKILELLSDTTKYESIRHNAWLWSKQFTFENSYQDFLKILNIERLSKKS